MKDEVFNYLKGKSIICRGDEVDHIFCLLHQLGFRGWLSRELLEDAVSEVYFMLEDDGRLFLQRSPDNNRIVISSEDFLKLKYSNETRFESCMKSCPIGTILYSPVYGEVEYLGRCPYDSEKFEYLNASNETVWSNLEGKISKGGECVIYPSKEVRNWRDFDGDWSALRKSAPAIHNMHPGDYVITRRATWCKWRLNIFDHMEKKGGKEIAVCLKGKYSWQNIQRLTPETECLLGK